ncbi:hypothetical protein ACS15_1270 [Ralstonia insidiosa]|uniref:DUF4236 domain-containing protein n=1 Tax=Ralstonia insidiosa TaxID=190721 RepID=A0AAC9BGJ8_9RALS|nr:hypothetical protein ACS15_1270 [Ralstonia insidiosa]
MPFRFQRRVKIAPGLHLNVSKSGISLSIGGKGATLNVGSRRGPRATAGIPGTGLSYSRSAANPRDEAEPGRSGWPWVLTLIVLALAASWFYFG